MRPKRRESSPIRIEDSSGRQSIASNASEELITGGQAMGSVAKLSLVLRPRTSASGVCGIVASLTAAASVPEPPERSGRAETMPSASATQRARCKGCHLTTMAKSAVRVRTRTITCRSLSMRYAYVERSRHVDQAFRTQRSPVLRGTMIANNAQPVINERLLACTSRAALHSEMEEFADALSFNYFCLVAVETTPKGYANHDLAINIPRAYSDAFHDMNLSRTDPVMAHLKKSWSPLFWDEAYYDCQGRRERWESIESYGLRSGAALALHMPGGRHVLVGFDQRRDTISSPVKRQETLAALTLFSTYIAEPVVALLCATNEPTPKLSVRELECLKWRGEGKSAWETASILNLSESRVAKVCAAATKKLGCVTTSQAALKALRVGLFS